MERRRRVHHQQAAAAADMAELGERRQIVVADLADVRRDGERSAVEVVERVAVRRSLGDRLHGDAAGVAGPILEDQRLSEQRLERARQRPRAGFGRAARGVADHQADRLARITLRERNRERRGEQQCDAEHDGLPLRL